MSILVVFLAIFISGIAGGIGGAFMGDDFLLRESNNEKIASIRGRGNVIAKDWWDLITRIILGVLAAFVVPLFLVLAAPGQQGSLVTSLLGKPPDPQEKWWCDLLVLIGFCIVAALISQRFLSNVADRLLKQAKQDASSALHHAKEANAQSKKALSATQFLGPYRELDEISKAVLRSFLDVSEFPASTEKIAEQVKRDVNEVSEVLRDLKEDNFITQDKDTGRWKLREWGKIRTLADIGLGREDTIVMNIMKGTPERRPSGNELSTEANLSLALAEAALRRLERFGLVARSSSVENGWRLRSRGKAVLNELKAA